MFQAKEQDKLPEKGLNEMEISILPDKELKVTVIKMVTDGEINAGAQREFKQRDRKYKRAIQR